MATLPLTTTTPSHSRRSSRPIFAKPSHFTSHAKRSRHLRISCADTNKVDRRNMLLGMGGLYGAANLISTPASASEGPIPAPDPSSCHLGKDWNTGGKPIPENDKCCLIYNGEEIKNYKLPPVSKPRMRPSAHSVSQEYIYKYNKAIDAMKRLPADHPHNFRQQANIHCAYCNATYYQPGTELDIQVHHSWIFFPFHRWYLYFFEKIVGKYCGDPNFALPFWNWDNPMGMTTPPMFLDTQSNLYNSTRISRSTDSIVDLGWTEGTDPSQLKIDNLSVMHTEMIRGNANACHFMGKPFRKGDKPDDGGDGSSERGSHTSIHRWVGGDMGNFYTAGRDPLFYCHHANVDRMWTLWQYFLPSEKVPEKRIVDRDFLDASFLFWDENEKLVRVTVEDSLSNLKMGYEYERIDLPWLDYRPPRQAAGAKVRRAKISAQKVADIVFPINLDKIVRIIVPKTGKGKLDELLELKITLDSTKLLKFDVFVNDEDDDYKEVHKASYAGTYAQIPSHTNNATVTTSISLKLTDLYEDMDVEDDDTVLVTLVPRHQGPGVTVGGIRITENKKPGPNPPTRYEC